MPATSINLHTTLGTLLLAAPELGQVWERLGVNPTCDGSRTLVELCESQGPEWRAVSRWWAELQASGPNADRAKAQFSWARGGLVVKATGLRTHLS
jgi:hypothetical protein